MGVVEIFWAEGGRDISVDAGGDDCQWVSLQCGAGGDRVCDGGNVDGARRIQNSEFRSPKRPLTPTLSPEYRGEGRGRGGKPQPTVLCFDWGVAGGGASA